MSSGPRVSRIRRRIWSASVRREWISRLILTWHRSVQDFFSDGLCCKSQGAFVKSSRCPPINHSEASMRLAFLLSFILVLTGCVTGIQVPYKLNASWSDTDTTAKYCSREAVKLFPVNIQTRSGGGYSTPAYTNCYGGYYGNVSCTTTGGNYVAPYSYDVDANSTRRENAYKECLASRGYELKTVRQCDGDVISTLAKLKANPVAAQKQLTNSSCAIQEGNLVYISY